MENETATATATSPELSLLLVVASAAAFWIFIWKTRNERRTTKFVVWIWENYPEAWRAQPWVYRYLLRGQGLRRLARGGAISDPHFAEEYAHVVPMPRHIRIAAALGIVSVALMLAGTRLFGWTWGV